MIKYRTTVTGSSVFSRNFEYITDDPTWWMVDTRDNLDINYAEDLPLATHRAGTYIAVSCEPFHADEPATTEPDENESSIDDEAVLDD